MVSILLCSSLPAENCFKAESEQLLEMDEHTDFPESVGSSTGGILYLKISLFSIIYINLWQT